jgi:hypothetical protein
MERYKEPEDVEVILGDLRYRTGGATILAVGHARDWDRGAPFDWVWTYLFRTAKGNYFLQRDEQSARDASWRSKIDPINLGSAVSYYEKTLLIH